MYVCPECGLTFSSPGVCGAHGAELREAHDPLLGQVIGSYRIAGVVGEGGMGRVYKAVHPQIGSRVAIKVLSEQCSQNRTLVERFFAEARAVNVIRHESIVNVLDIATLADGRPYIVMEFLDGEPLSAAVRRGGLPFKQIVSIMIDVLRGLAIAHDKGIIHRDLKSDNVFITREGRAKVLDFGIAKLVPEMGGVQEGTRTGALLGTPHYMSPEQALARPIDARTDLYSLGVILYEAITGRRPFDGSTLYELLKQHIETPPPPPRSLRPDLPAALESVLLRALAKNPAERFQSAEEFARALENSTADLSPSLVASYAGNVVPAHTPSAISSQLTPQNAPHSPSLPFPSSASGPYPSSPQNAYGAPPSNPQAAYGPPPGAAITPPHLARPPKPQRSMLPVVLGIGCAGVLVLSAAVAGILWLRASGLTSNRTALTGSNPTTTPTATSTSSPLSTVSNQTLDTPFDKKRFDPSAFLSRAEELAKNHYPDAVMVAVDIVGMNQAGIVDFSTQAQNSVIYRFRSPSHSVAPPDFPSNATFESNCMVYVMASATGINSFIVDRWACDTPLLGKPRCSPAAAWKKAELRGAPKGNVIGSIGYGPDDKGKPRWYIIIPPNFTTLLPDDC